MTNQEVAAESKRLLNKRDAVKAIEFSLTIDDHYEARDFLRSWLHGDTSEWPEFEA